MADEPVKLNLSNSNQVGSRFVSSSDLESARLKREEEWRATYERLGQEPPPMPKEDYDGRSLYEKLKETKDKKQEAFEEKLKFKNQFRALDDEEIAFLDDAAQEKRMAEIEKERKIREEMESFKKAVANRVAEPPPIVASLLTKPSNINSTIENSQTQNPSNQTTTSSSSSTTTTTISTIMGSDSISILPRPKKFSTNNKKRSKDFQSSFLAGAIKPKSSNPNTNPKSSSSSSSSSNNNNKKKRKSLEGLKLSSSIVNDDDDFNSNKNLFGSDVKSAEKDDNHDSKKSKTS